MKNFILGVFCFLLFIDFFNMYEDYVLEKYMPGKWNEKQYSNFKKSHPIVYKVGSWTLTPSAGLYSTLTKRCTKDLRNYGGKKYQRRKYFKCNKIQSFVSDIVFGEYVMPRKK